VHVLATVNAHGDVVALHGAALVCRRSVGGHQDHGWEGLGADAAPDPNLPVVGVVTVTLVLIP